MRTDGASQPRGAFACAESSNGAKFGDNTLCRNRRNTNQLNSHSHSSRNVRTSVDRRSNMSRPRRIPGFYMLSFMCIVYVLCLSNDGVYGDDVDELYTSGISPGLEMTTPEFDYASRGRKKFGDKCETTLECGFPGSVCDPKKKTCQCSEDLPVTNHIDKCGKESAINETCFFNEQCEIFHFQTECLNGRCICRFEMSPIWNKDGTFECKGIKEQSRDVGPYVDPAMIGVLVGMALMFIIICVVLRLFSKARWRENRTIFNTPNPRLMNVSLLRDSKLLHGQERRGSRMSVRAPSRQPSMASLRPHSPNPSLGSKPGSRGSSSLSLRSNKSGAGIASNSQEKHNMNHPQNPAQQPLITNITSNPGAESITVEITDSDKT